MSIKRLSAALTLMIVVAVVPSVSSLEDYRFTFMVVYSFVENDWSLDVYKWLNDTVYAETLRILDTTTPMPKPDSVEARMYVVEGKDGTYTGYLRLAFIEGVKVVGWEERIRFNPANKSWEILWAEEIYRGDLRGWNAPVESGDTVAVGVESRISTGTLTTPVTIVEIYTYSGSNTVKVNTTTTVTTLTVTTTETFRYATAVTRTFPGGYVGWDRILEEVENLPEARGFLERHENEPIKEVYMGWVSMRDGIVWVMFYAGGREGAWSIVLGYDVKGGKLIYSSGAHTAPRTGGPTTRVSVEDSTPTSEAKTCRLWGMGALDLTIVTLVVVLFVVVALILRGRGAKGTP